MPLLWPQDIYGCVMEWLKLLYESFTKIDLMIAVGLFLLLLLLLWRQRRWKIRKRPARDAVRGYRLIYADRKQGRKGEEDFGKLLYSAEYELQGKPDYIFCSPFRHRIVPVELKSGRIGEEDMPHYGDYLQLGAYFLILEDVYGKRPPFGRLVYQDMMFEIRNTAKIRKEVSHTLKEMREMLQYGVGTPNNSFAHCRPCICNGTVCTFSETETEGELQ